jgi:hypothetical protein
LTGLRGLKVLWENNGDTGTLILFNGGIFFTLVALLPYSFLTVSGVTSQLLLGPNIPGFNLVSL